MLSNSQIQDRLGAASQFDPAAHASLRRWFTLPSVLRQAIGHDPGCDAVLAGIFECPLAQAESALHDFLETLGVSTRFESYGVSSLESERMVREALSGVRGKNFIGAAGLQAP